MSQLIKRIARLRFSRYPSPATSAGPAQLEPTPATHAKLVICDYAIERTFAWLGLHRRLARDYERLEKTLVGFHFVAFAVLMDNNCIKLMIQSA
jgi:hypothetical protein